MNGGINITVNSAGNFSASAGRVKLDGTITASDSGGAVPLSVTLHPDAVTLHPAGLTVQGAAPQALGTLANQSLVLHLETLMAGAPQQAPALAAGTLFTPAAGCAARVAGECSLR